MVEGKALEANVRGAQHRCWVPTKKRITFNLIVGHDDFRSHPFETPRILWYLDSFRYLSLVVVFIFFCGMRAPF